MIYALIMLVRWLCLYFQAHIVVVLTDQPLKLILQWLDTVDQIANWVVKLSKFNIQYWSRSSLKVQVLADFIMEYSISYEELTSESPKEIIEDSYWILHVDGASNSKENRIGLILANPEDVVTEHALRFNFNT